MEEKATTKHIVLRGANANRPMVRRNAMSDTAALMRGGRGPACPHEQSAMQE
jgi:hypothetical protein